jgi:methyl-accepting chemotaxis protein
VGEGAKNIADTVTAIDEIVNAAADVATMVQEIAAAAEEQSASVEEVTASMEDVSATSEQSAASTQETSAAIEEQSASMDQLVNAAQEMARLSEELQIEVSRFNLNSSNENIHCWDVMKCGNEIRHKCPAYNSAETRCWLIEGTWCGGAKQGDAKSKLHNCMACKAFKKKMSTNG